jgi:hypothetical protein
MLGNTLGKANKGKTGLSGDKSGKWNPNKSELRQYTNRVHWLTKKVYDANIDTINPLNYPRTLCGIDGGYQLDHIMSIKEGFTRNIPPEQMATLDNLQMLPWKENRTKHTQTTGNSI